MHLHHCRFFQEHVRMLLQSLRALCKALGGAASMWKYLEALARATAVSGRLAYGFGTELRFADVMSTYIRAWMATMWMRMRWKKHRKPMMDQHRMWRTECIVGLSWEPVMSTGMRSRMATMRMRIRRPKYCKLMMDQCRMSRTEGIVQESVRIAQYISDL